MYNTRQHYLGLAIGLLMSSTSMAATISGKITDEQGAPIAGAKVTLEGSHKQAVSGEDGSYIIENVDPEHVHLHVYSINHVHGDKDVGKIGDTYNADFVLAPSSIENIVVTANTIQTSVLESVTPVTVISAKELRERQAPTLGETLSSTPGVHSSYFGPVASSPIIRGTDGPRVKVVQNGLDTSDASRIGPDHNVATDVSTAHQVEVLRGPATLQYGSGAIGGVVNIVDNRIPKEKFDGVQGEAEVRFESAGDERFGKIDLTGGTGDWMFHVDAFDRKTDDYDIPGYELAEPHEEDVEGTLNDSAIDTTNFTLGTSYITDSGYVGFAYENLDNFYGIPGHSHGHEDEHEHDEDHDEHEGEEHEAEADESVNLSVDMDRYQVAGELFKPFDGFSSLKFSGAYTDYEHTEFESGAVGTVFANETSEARFALHHEDFNGWHGVFGLQYSNVEFSALGEEAYTPPSETDSFALFIIEEKRFDNVTVQLGGRVEQTDISVDPFTIDFALHEEHDEHDEDHDEDHEDEHEHEEEHDHEDEHEHDELALDLADFSYTSVSLSAGAVWEYQPGYSIALSLSRSERAPSHQELLSAGNHISTQTYDLGAIFTLDDDHLELSSASIEEETSTNIDITWRRYIGDWGITLSAFYNSVDDYLYQANTGLIAEAFEHDHGDEDHDEDHGDEHGEEEHGEEGFPVYRFLQDDAKIYGFEAQINYQINDMWDVEVFGDYIRAEVDSDNLPRIPPMKIGAELGFEHQNWFGDVEVIWYDKQDDVAQFETATDGYTLVNLSVNYQYQSADLDWVFFLRGTNLTDEEARVHTSFLKDQAPLPSRGVTLGVRASF